MICDKDLDDTNPDFYVDMNPAVRLQSQKMACTLRIGWDKDQGMPSIRRENDQICNPNEDCISKRCDLSWNFVSSVCIFILLSEHFL